MTILVIEGTMSLFILNKELEVISKPFGASQAHRPDEKSHHRFPAPDCSGRSGAGSYPDTQ